MPETEKASIYDTMQIPELRDEINRLEGVLDSSPKESEDYKSAENDLFHLRNILTTRSGGNPDSVEQH